MPSLLGLLATELAEAYLRVACLDCDARNRIVYGGILRYDGGFLRWPVSTDKAVVWAVLHLGIWLCFDYLLLQLGIVAAVRLRHEIVGFEFAIDRGRLTRETTRLFVLLDIVQCDVPPKIWILLDVLHLQLSGPVELDSCQAVPWVELAAPLVCRLQIGLFFRYLFALKLPDESLHG